MANSARFGVGKRGGPGRGQGRKPGSKNKTAKELRAIVLAMTQKSGNSAKDEMIRSFQYLGALSRAHAEAGDIAEAAKYAVMASEAGARAAPYMHSRMPAAMTVTHKYDLSKLNDAQFAEFEHLAAIASDHGADPGGEEATQH